MKQWFIVKLFIHYLKKLNEQQELGLKLDEILDEKFGARKSEQIQDEIIVILEKTIVQLKSDRKEG